MTEEILQPNGSTDYRHLGKVILAVLTSGDTNRNQ